MYRYSAWQYCKFSQAFITIIFITVDKSPPMMKTIGIPCMIPTTPTTPTTCSPRTPTTSPFSAFKSPIYGDPRSFGVPHIRRTVRD